MTEADDLADFVGLGDLVGDLDPTKDGGSRDVPHEGPEDGRRSPSVLMSSNRLSSTVSPETFLSKPHHKKTCLRRFEIK